MLELVIKKEILSRIFLQLLQFITGLLIARNLGVAGHGIFSLFLTEASFFILLVGVSFESTIIFFLTQKKISLPEIIDLIIKLFGLQVIILALALGALSFCTNFMFFNSSVVNNGIIMLSLFVFSSIIINSVAALFYASNLILKYNVFLITTYIMFLALLFFSTFGYSTKKLVNTIIFFYTVFILIQGITAILLLFFHFRKTTKIFRKKVVLSKEIIKYCLVVFSCNLIQFLCYKMDFWIIDFYGNKTQVGLYSVASKTAQLWWVLPQICASIFFPLISMGNLNNIYFKKALVKISLFSFLTGVVAYFIYPYFINSFIGTEFKESYSPFILLLPGVICFSLNILLAAKYSGEGAVLINLKSSVCCFFLIVIFDFMLIPKYNINGAAIASTIAYIVTTGYALKQYKYVKAV